MSLILVWVLPWRRWAWNTSSPLFLSWYAFSLLDYPLGRWRLHSFCRAIFLDGHPQTAPQTHFLHSPWLSYLVWAPPSPSSLDWSPSPKRLRLSKNRHPRPSRSFITHKSLKTLFLFSPPTVCLVRTSRPRSLRWPPLLWWLFPHRRISQWQCRCVKVYWSWSKPIRRS